MFRRSPHTDTQHGNTEEQRACADGGRGRDTHREGERQAERQAVGVELVRIYLLFETKLRHKKSHIEDRNATVGHFPDERTRISLTLNLLLLEIC